MGNAVQFLLRVALDDLSRRLRAHLGRKPRRGGVWGNDETNPSGKGGHYCPSLPSEPCMQLSPHTAQADRYLPCCPTAAAPDCLFISGSVCKANGSHLTCPSDFDRPFRSRQVVHQAHVSTLSVGQTPYPAGYGFPLPFGRWPSLLGPSFPAEEFRPSCVGPTGRPPDRSGVSTFRS